MEVNDLGRFAPKGPEGWKQQSNNDEEAEAQRSLEIEHRELVAKAHNKDRTTIEKMKGQNKVDEVGVARAEAEIVDKNFNSEKVTQEQREMILDAMNETLKKVKESGRRVSAVAPDQPNGVDSSEYIDELELDDIIIECSERFDPEISKLLGSIEEHKKRIEEMADEIEARRKPVKDIINGVLHAEGISEAKATMSGRMMYKPKDGLFK